MPSVHLWAGQKRIQAYQCSRIVDSVPRAGMFGILSIPTGLLQNSRGKKFVLILGLSVILAGVLNASFGITTFSRFLVTVVLLGAGAAILQVAGNPSCAMCPQKAGFHGTS